MSAPIGDEDLRLVRLLDRGATVAGEPGVAGLVRDLAHSVIKEGRSPGDADRAVRSRRRRTGVAAAVLVAGLATAAFGYGVTAHTGHRGPAASDSDSSEWLRRDAPDFRQAVEQLRPTDMPLPPGQTFSPFVDHILSTVEGEPALEQVTSVRAGYAFYAACAWEREWLTARAAGDRARTVRAVEVLRDFPTWPEVAKVDGGGMRDYHRKIAEAAANGDEATIRADLPINCSAYQGEQE